MFAVYEFTSLQLMTIEAKIENRKPQILKP
jgi:hypothetical protein